MNKNSIILKSVGASREVFPLSHKPDIGEPYYTMTLENSRNKKTIDIQISREDFLGLVDFMAEISEAEGGMKKRKN